MSEPETSQPTQQGGLIWNMPYPRHANFTGRAEQLGELRKALTKKTIADHMQVLWAIGGTGKTQLAVEYAYRHRWEYQIIWWLRASDPTTLALSYSQMAEQLGMRFGSEVSTEDIRHIIRSMLAQRSDWLLIFDNAGNEEEIEKYIPQPCNGHVLITTRNSNWRGKATVQLLPPLRRGEAIALLRTRTNRIDSNESASKLAQALGDLPLALEQAGAVIDLGAVSFTDYLKRFESFWAELLQRGVRQYSEYPEPVTMTCELAIRELETQAQGCAELLTYCAFFATEQISIEFLSNSADLAPDPLRGAILSSPLTLSSSLAWLSQFALAESGEQGISIHRLVAQLTRDRLGVESRRVWTEHAINRISSVFNFQSQDPSTWARCGELISHVLAVTKHGQEQHVWLGGVAALLDLAGRYLMRVGQFTQAREMLSRAMGIYENLHGNRSPSVSAVANNLGRVMTKLGEHSQAQLQFQRALSIDQATYGDNDPRVATVVNNYAMALHAGGDATSARSQFEWVLRVYEFHYGADHFKTATVLNNLGFVMHQLGDLETARAHLERALSITQATHGESHPLAGSILCNLGNIYRSQHDLDRVREVLERALSIDEAAFGRVHPDVARDCEAMALLLESIGDMSNAQEHIQRALAIDESVYGAEHPLVLRRLVPLQRIARRAGDDATADACGARMSAIQAARTQAASSVYDLRE